MTTVEAFLAALLIIFSAPYLIWRIAKTEYYVPLVVVQIVTGILLGPGLLGAALPDYYALVFNGPVVQALNGIAAWAVMLFVWIAGIELDVTKAWEHRRDAGVTAGLALATPLAFGCVAAAVLLLFDGWIGANAAPWQYVTGVGMACAVTALPILILFMEKLEILRTPLGQRILRYASLDDIAIWIVLAVILLDAQRIGRQGLFLLLFLAVGYGFRKLMPRLPARDRWYVGLMWLASVSLAADWAGLHFMVGAFLSGAVIDSAWFDQEQTDRLRHNVLLILMPVFFLSTGLRTEWALGGTVVLLAALMLLVAAVGGKLAGMLLAERLLRWPQGDGWLVGWLLQTKALIMIVFVNVLLDERIISRDTFTALLLMAVASTTLTIPAVTPAIMRLSGKQESG